MTDKVLEAVEMADLTSLGRFLEGVVMHPESLREMRGEFFPVANMEHPLKDAKVNTFQAFNHTLKVYESSDVEKGKVKLIASPYM